MRHHHRAHRASDDGRPEISTLIVPSGTPGFTVEPAYDKLGWHASDTHGLTFDDCRVPEDALLGPRGDGLRQMLGILDDGRIAIAALSVGLIAACLDECVAYAGTRTTFGQPIGSRQGVAFPISDLAVDLEAARLLTYQAASLKDAGRGRAEVSKAAAIAKLFSTEAAVKATRTATQVFGGYGFMEESPVARLYRDAKILEVGEGTSEVQRMVIARHLGLPLTTGRDLMNESERLTARERVALLFDEGTFVEDGALANALAEGLPADGVVTGQGLVEGRPALVVANDWTVKAGSWGARTVEKIVRVTERALAAELPIFWFIDSAGARITDQVDLFPGRRGAGRIFANQVALSGRVPQICCLFGPSAAGGAYIPAFCDVVFMVEERASMYLGSPRMAEVVIGETVTLEEMGGARMHATVSGCGDNLVADDREAIEDAKYYFNYLPPNWRDGPPRYDAQAPAAELTASVIPESESAPFDMHAVIDGLVDADSFFELKPLFAAELVTGLARIDGRAVGVVANNSAVRGGVLFNDSADKAARFIWFCDAFNIPLLYLADVPGFMIGAQVERQGIIRHGAKMITAVAEATVPQISVIVRKAYGAGLYAMGGPGFSPDACLALPTAHIAVMGPDAAVNAVYAKKIEAIADPGRARGLRRSEASRVRGGRRPDAAGVRPGDRRHRRGRRPARGTGAPLRSPGRKAPTAAREAPRRPTWVTHGVH